MFPPYAVRLTNHLNMYIRAKAQNFQNKGGFFNINMDGNLHF